MITFALLIQLGLCIVILHRELVCNKSRNFATTLFVGIYSILYVIEPMILHVCYGGARSIVRGETNLFTDDLAYIIFNSIGFVFLSSCLLISFYRKQSRTFHLIPHNINTISPDAVGVMIALGLASFVYGAGASLIELLMYSRFGWMQNEGYKVFFIVLSTYLIALTPTYIYLVSIGKRYSKFVFIFAVLSVILFGVITKDRKWVFYIFSGWLAAKYHKDGCKLNLSYRTLLLASILFGFILLSQFLRDVVPSLFLTGNVDVVDAFQRSASSLFELSDISYFYRATIEAIQQNINNGFFVPLGLLRRVLFFFVPTGLSGGVKIEDISAIFSDVVGGEDALRRGSMPPGLFGLFVISFGWIFTVFLMPLLAIFVAKLDTYFTSDKSLVHVAIISFYFTAIVFLFRGDESTAFYFPIINILLLFYLSRMLSITLSQKYNSYIKRSN